MYVSLAHGLFRASGFRHARLGPRSGYLHTAIHSIYISYTHDYDYQWLLTGYKVIQGYDRARLWYIYYIDRAVPRLRSTSDRAKKPMRTLAHLWTSLNPKFCVFFASSHLCQLYCSLPDDTPAVNCPRLLAILSLLQELVHRPLKTSTNPSFIGFASLILSLTHYTFFV